MVSGGLGKNERLSQILTQKTIETASSTGLDVHLVDSEKQVGQNFGEKFSNALESVFSQGYQNIIAIGNDTPDLKKEELLLADAQIQSGQGVLGPSLDGGVYLIGLSRKQFCSDSFKKIDWETQKVFVQLKQILSGPKPCLALLDYKRDIDSQSDIQLFLKESSHKHFLLIELKRICVETRRFFEFPPHTFKFINPSAQSLRAPPIFS